MKQGGRGGVCGNGGGVTAHSPPSFQNPGNRPLAAVCKMSLLHVSGFFKSCQHVGCDLEVCLKNTFTPVILSNSIVTTLGVNLSRLVHAIPSIFLKIYNSLSHSQKTLRVLQVNK